MPPPFACRIMNTNRKIISPAAPVWESASAATKYPESYNSPPAAEHRGASGYSWCDSPSYHHGIPIHWAHHRSAYPRRPASASVRRSQIQGVRSDFIIIEVLHNVGIFGFFAAGFQPVQQENQCTINTTTTSRYAPIPRPFFGVKLHSLHSVEKKTGRQHCRQFSLYHCEGTAASGLRTSFSISRKFPAPAAVWFLRPDKLLRHSPRPRRKSPVCICQHMSRAAAFRRKIRLYQFFQSRGEPSAGKLHAVAGLSGTQEDFTFYFIIIQTRICKFFMNICNIFRR